jgi:chorismate dehydratase
VTRSLRLGAVSYLNARPLVYGIEEGHRPQATGRSLEFHLRFDVPAECARLLATGQIDLGLVPTITYLDRPDDRFVPDVAIASDGPVASVAIFTRTPIERVRTLALDTSSRTSVALTRILCAKLFQIAPAFTPEAPDLEAMLRAADAALLIGDPALFVDYDRLDAQKIDLGDSWTTLTGLPFVWAAWSGAANAADADVVRRLQEVRDAGLAHSDQIADAYTLGDPVRQAIGRRYLRESIRYDLPPRALQGLETYFRFAAELGLVKRAKPIQFFPER